MARAREEATRERFLRAWTRQAEVPTLRTEYSIPSQCVSPFLPTLNYRRSGTLGYWSQNTKQFIPRLGQSCLYAGSKPSKHQWLSGNLCPDSWVTLKVYWTYTLRSESESDSIRFDLGPGMRSRIAGSLLYSSRSHRDCGKLCCAGWTWVWFRAARRMLWGLPMQVAWMGSLVKIQRSL